MSCITQVQGLVWTDSMVNIDNGFKPVKGLEVVYRRMNWYIFPWLHGYHTYLSTQQLYRRFLISRERLSLASCKGCDFMWACLWLLDNLRGVPTLHSGRDTCVKINNNRCVRMRVKNSYETPFLLYIRLLEIWYYPQLQILSLSLSLSTIKPLI